MHTGFYKIIVAVVLLGTAGGGRATAQCMENIGHRYPTTFTQHGDTLVLGVTFGEEKMKINYSCQRQQDGSLVVIGTVAYAKTGETLPYVTVSSLWEIYPKNNFVPWEELAVTDSLGCFSFRRPALSQRMLAFWCAGYRPELFEEHWDTIAVSEHEYLMQRDVSQRFDTAAVSPEERDRLTKEYYEVFHSCPGCDEYAWLESEGLRCRIGRFQPSGTLGVHMLWPIDDRRSFYFNGMHYTNFYADRLFALSPEGVFASQSPSSGDLRDHLHISLIDGNEVSGFHALALDSTQGVLTGLRWAEGGWLYFRTERGGCYKLHVDMHPQTNCRMEDVEVSEAEYLAAKASFDQYNHARKQYDTPTVADTAAVLRYREKYNMSWWDPMGADSQEVEYFHLEGTDIDIVEIAIGDGCTTIITGDTAEMDACWLALSKEGVFAGYQVPLEVESPGYIYLYPLRPHPQPFSQGEGRGMQVAEKWVYQTTPAWFPYDGCFWGSDGWLYLEGRAGNHDRVVYHKVRMKGGE